MRHTMRRMGLLIDAPTWPGYGLVWSHLVSDTSVEELTAFARRVGLPDRLFEGDHYDVPVDLHERVVAAGARRVTTREVLHALTVSGQRLPKRTGDKGVARVLGVRFPDGTSADVDLIAASRPARASRVFAAMVFVRDSEGSLAVVYSVRRGEWGSPGGWREGEESVEATAVREVWEETGLRVPTGALEPVGYERFRAVERGGLWRPGQDLLQTYRVDLHTARPPLTTTLADTSDRRWVTWPEYAELCGEQFWFPLAARVLA